MFHVKRFEKLSQFAEKNNLALSTEDLEKFSRFCSTLITENKVMNLTAIDDPDEIEIKHFIDSLEAVSLIRRLWRNQNRNIGCEEKNTEMSSSISEEVGQGTLAESFRLVDVGTGAGFPGIPLKICFKDAHFTLLDSLNKRILFLNKVIEQLDLDHIEAVSERAEDFAKVGSVSRETFDFCVSRAVAEMAVLLEYCLPMVRVGGYCILYKSGDFQEELEHAEKAMEVLGGELEGIEEFTLPESDARRCLIRIKKIKATPEKYPRRSGKPSKSPIK